MDVPNEQLLAATAALRFEHDAKARQAQGPRPESNFGKRDLTVGEALFEMEENMLSDKFWAELGQSVFHARQGIQKKTEEGRTEAIEKLKSVAEQIRKIEGLYWANERSVIDKVLALLEAGGEEPVTEETLLGGVRTTVSEGQSYSQSQSKRGKDFMQLGKDVLEQQKKAAAQGPWEFEEILDQMDVTVTIKVPASTQKSDVKVVCTDTQLLVKVAGHELQPSVIDGELAAAVQPDSFSWTLEGKDEKRKLVIVMDKKMGGFMWGQLLK
eukprot:TRINITY_DN57977_c0_g1_i1.p1 TRINITY_DN57977_c0_g1~~TRINITY_DN57977_c0_g1_i1.p1  ORF type:complete len:296 (+),score=85.64 TRINITY_DN57977_c0_g1_i1:84-890(+)